MDGGKRAVRVISDALGQPDSLTIGKENCQIAWADARSNASSNLVFVYV